MGRAPGRAGHASHPPVQQGVAKGGVGHETTWRQHSFHRHVGPAPLGLEHSAEGAVAEDVLGVAEDDVGEVDQPAQIVFFAIHPQQVDVGDEHCYQDQWERADVQHGRHTPVPEPNSAVFVRLAQRPALNASANSQPLVAIFPCRSDHSTLSVVKPLSQCLIPLILNEYVMDGFGEDRAHHVVLRARDFGGPLDGVPFSAVQFGSHVARRQNMVHLRAVPRRSRDDDGVEIGVARCPDERVVQRGVDVDTAKFPRLVGAERSVLEHLAAHGQAPSGLELPHLPPVRQCNLDETLGLGFVL
mmetsp:Transcript_73488/g.239094  ORF Transcript_73488/g.239094 Transcript_73488/m.239094 type:complete len:300 (-) Transcript_73488:1174-2073(-)